VPEVENDYVATATAEKRLRDVLTERFDNAVDTQYLMDTLLNAAEITYLPRKKSVSITLRVPETATTSKPAKNGKVPSDGYPDKQTYDEAQLARVYDDTDPVGTAADAEAPDMTPVPGAVEKFVRDSKPKVARFGEFVPMVTSAPEYHEDDYFTE
jgi:hypothetical protein